jgi:hypothetical protein
MSPELVLSTIKAGFDFGTELLKFLQTDQGRDLVKQSLEDRAKWDAFWSQTGDGMRKFFTGQLFIPKPS